MNDARYSLDVGGPNAAPEVLRRTAERYRADAVELAATWQDSAAGKIWDDFAGILEAAAEKCERAMKRRGC